MAKGRALLISNMELGYFYENFFVQKTGRLDFYSFSTLNKTWWFFIFDFFLDIFDRLERPVEQSMCHSIDVFERKN